LAAAAGPRRPLTKAESKTVRHRILHATVLNR
jgi:hypothetical protein